MTRPDPIEPDRVRRPHRTCVGCRGVAPQEALVRCVLGPAGPALDRRGPGRGAWLCSADCFDAAVRRGAFDRAWRVPVDREALERLRPAVAAAVPGAVESGRGGWRSGHPSPQ